jgi:threonine dehydratase
VSAFTLEYIRAAHARIRDRVHRTPVLTSCRLDDLSGATLFFKCENLQKTGAFKARGALNAVLSLSDAEAAKGVVTHSSGNHAAALAWAARARNISVCVVMPRTASGFKVAAVERYGGQVVYCEPNHKSREETAARIVAETGAHLVHPYNDLRVMAGQATAALELLDEVPDLDAVVCPVGGGGLLAGTAVVARSIRPGIKVFAGEPEGAADASRSLAAGQRTPVASPASIADGLLAFVGDLTFPEIQRHVDAIVTVSDAEIVAAGRRLLEVLKVAVEPSGAVGYAAVAGGKLEVAGRRIGIILSGGNVDLDRAPWSAPAAGSAI